MPISFARPPGLRPPDPAEWERRHGAKPFDLFPDDPDRCADLLAMAARLDREDWSELDARAVHHIRAGMDAVCAAAAVRAGIMDDETLVFLDPARNVFTAYPSA